MKIQSLLITLFLVSGSFVNAAGLVDFEELTTFTPGSGNMFYNGDSGSGSNSDGWTSNGASFNNSYSSDFGGFWSGWSYSKVVNSTTAGPSNQYASFTGGGADQNGDVDPSGIYAVAFGNGAFFNLPNASYGASLLLTNTTYTAIAVRDGNDGGNNFITGAFGSMASINSPGYSASLDPLGNDFLRVTLTGYDDVDGTGGTTGSVSRYLADYRSDKSDNPDASLYANADYVLDRWIDVDLTALGHAKSISLSFDSTDVGTFGPNSPFYVAIDNLSLTMVPEPTAAMPLLVAVTGLIARRRRS